jgi:hypothetical protein
MSKEDIEPGTRWHAAITEQLDGTSIGIICITAENRNAPWLLFEAGALAKGLSKSRVYTLLVDLTPTDVEYPLAAFQHTQLNAGGILSLVASLNSALGERGIDSHILEKAFTRLWPDLKEEIDAILSSSPSSAPSPARSQGEILEELVRTTRETATAIGTVVELMRGAPNFALPQEDLDAMLDGDDLLRIGGRRGLGKSWYILNRHLFREQADREKGEPEV